MELWDKMVTGYNICKNCKGKIHLSRNSKNPESKIKDVCLNCYNKMVSLNEDELFSITSYFR